jgi:hypothetical protein
MARSGKRRMHNPRCRRCRLQRLPEETFPNGKPGWTRGLCPACLELDRQRRRSATARRLLDKAKDGGTVERDGQMFHVVVLPPKRRSGKR